MVKLMDQKESFSYNWRFRKESRRNYWTRRQPMNQIQLAFRKHWEVFTELIGGTKGKHCLEVGCGRGTISSYFADNGFDCTLLDSSVYAIELAKEIFSCNGHKGNFILGDARKLPFREYSFDVVVSIGLLEHFEDITHPLLEQIKVLRRDGVLLCYIVPDSKNTVQKYFRPVNKLIKKITFFFNRIDNKNNIAKAELFRSNYTPEDYLKVLPEKIVKDVKIFGLYPLPMISYSPEFPFSLMCPLAEFSLTRLFEGVLWLRRVLFNRNPWICNVNFGQAFLLTLRNVLNIPAKL